MSGRPVLELTQSQVEQIVRAAAGASGASSHLLTALSDTSSTLAAEAEHLLSSAEDDGRRLSRSLLSGLLVLARFPLDGDYLGIAQIADSLGMSASTTHRYVSTLLATGLLERDPATRRYRLSSALDGSTAQNGSSRGERRAR